MRRNDVTAPLSWPAEVVDRWLEIGVAEQVVAVLDLLPQPQRESLVAAPLHLERQSSAAMVFHVPFEQRTAARGLFVHPDTVLPVHRGVVRALSDVAEEGSHQTCVKKRILVFESPGLVLVTPPAREVRGH